MPTLTDDQLAAWKQLQWATALITSRFRRDLAAAGLSLEQFDVLVHLAWAPSGTLPLHELTASMVVTDALSRSGITRLLDRMERDGLITRTVSTSRPPPLRRLARHARAPAVRPGLARARRRDRALLRPAAGPPRHRRARQDPGQPDPGQPEPRPARLTPSRHRAAGLRNRAPAPTRRAHQRERPAASRHHGRSGRKLATRSPGRHNGRPAGTDVSVQRGTRQSFSPARHPAATRIHAMRYRSNRISRVARPRSCDRR